MTPASSGTRAQGMYANILVALDTEHGETMKGVLRAAQGIAAQHGARLHLLNVIPAAPVIVDEYLEVGYERLVSKDAEAKVLALTEDLGLDMNEISTHVRFGVIYQEVLAQAEKCTADLIVLGAHKAGFYDFLLGGNAARVVRHAACSVFVVR